MAIQMVDGTPYLKLNKDYKFYQLLDNNKQLDF